MPYREPDERALVRAEKDAGARLALTERAGRAVPARRRALALRKISTVGVGVGGFLGFITIMVGQFTHLPLAAWVAACVGVTLEGAETAIGIARRRRERNTEKEVRAAEAWLAGLPFTVSGYVAAIRSREPVRVSVTLAREPDVELISTLRDLTISLPNETVVYPREGGLLFFRRPTQGTIVDWCRALIEKVILPFHSVVPVVEVLVEDSPWYASLEMGPAVSGNERLRLGALYDSFVELRYRRTGEDVEHVTFEKFMASVTETRERVMAEHACTSVKLEVLLNRGKVVLQARPLKG